MLAFRSLTYRNFRWYLSGQVVSNTGTWMQRIAQDWLVVTLTGASGVALGTTIALQFLPMLLFGLWGGVIADRYSRRRLIMITQSSMGVLALGLGLLTVTGHVQAWHVYALAFGLGLATAVDNPARQSFVHEMVGREHLPNAVALNSASFQLGRVAGPAVAGLLIGLLGMGPVFLLNTLTFGAVITALATMRVRELHAVEREPRQRGQLRDGLRHVRDRPELMLPMVLMLFVSGIGLNFSITIALMAKGAFHTGASSFGLLSTALAVGSLVGALFSAARLKPRLRLLVGAALAFGLLEIACGLMPGYLTFMAVLLPTGFVSLVLTTGANSFVQLNSSSAMRGRVMSLYVLLFLGSKPLGAPLLGLISELAGARATLVFGGLVSVLAAVAVAGILAYNRNLVLRARIRPRPRVYVCARGRRAVAAGPERTGTAEPERAP